MMFEKGFVSMAYGDVGGPNLDFSNMGCFGFCPEEFTANDWLLLFVIILTSLYISYKIIKIVIRFIKYTVKTYKLKNKNVSEGFSVTQKEQNKSFNLMKELVVLWYCSILTYLIIAFLAASF